MDAGVTETLFICRINSERGIFRRNDQVRDIRLAELSIIRTEIVSTFLVILIYRPYPVVISLFYLRIIITSIRVVVSFFYLIDIERQSASILQEVRVFLSFTLIDVLTRRNDSCISSSFTAISIIYACTQSIADVH